jgi:hypothetical protein
MSVDVLRAHFGMLGQMPNPKPSPQKFDAAFVAALETTERWSFCQLAPLLIINFWDDFFLLRATPEASRGRLRFPGALALFFIEFEETAMPWPVKTGAKLETLLTGLAHYEMSAHQFRDEMLPVSGLMSFFHPHKLDTDWKLGGLWKCWNSTRRQNRELLTLSANAYTEEAAWVTDGILEGHLEASMALPFDQRTRDLKEIIQNQPKPAEPPAEDPSGLPRF